ncbi:MAG: phenylalanine--tRNA ligase subunit beta [Candidatus Harrisonbacteria bacterium]|nr:phenylalanine--tRNA ligase subunit beta [Candidatus Harrisonbacteria bacterium]
MRFSFSFIKKLAPGNYTKAELVEKFNLHVFEAVDLGGDILEISIPPNRYSDAASHLGIARETAVIMGLKLNDPLLKAFKPDLKERGIFTVNIKDKNSCFRYMATYVSGIKIGPTPRWMKNALEVCGLRSINNVVDIMNYVMLEVGQPLHAFDADKISGGIIVRSAKNNEQIETIDNQNFKLSPDDPVIADADSLQAIAGIKGGKLAEVSLKTSHILVEAASFSGINIYRSSHKLGLVTEAASRFAHELSPELAELGMKRALQLLKELTGAKIYSSVDVYPKKQARKLFKLDLKKINGIIGHHFSEKEISKALQPLGFKKIGTKVEIPALRTDISSIEDLAEEVARIYGYNNLIPQPPTVALGAATQEDQITLKDRARSLLVSAGYSEVYNYSFLSKKETSSSAVQLLNPISDQFEFLRDSLKPYLIRNLESNSRFFDKVRVFEIGKIFYINKGEVSEKLMLGIALLLKDSLLESKGIIDSLLSSIGVTDYETVERGNSLEFIIDGRKIGDLILVPGLKNASVAEVSLEELIKVTGEEREYKPLPKFPAITRDLSIFVPEDIRVGLILDLIQRVNPRLIGDVDLIDIYEPPIETLRDRSAEPEKRRKSLAFRIVFQAEDRTLTNAEVDREMAVINQVLIDRFDVELR